MADGVIDSLSIEIGASSKNAVKNINALVDAMKALKDAASHIDNSAAGKISALASAMKDLGDSKKVNISSKLGDNLSKLAGAMKAVKSEDISKLRQVASAVKTLDGTKGINISSKLADNIFNVAAAADSLTKTHADNLKMFGEALQTLSGGKLNIGDKLPDQLTNVAKAMDGITDDAIDRLRRMAEALSNLRGVNLQGFTGAVRFARQQPKPQNPPQQSGEQQNGGGSDSGKNQIEWTFNLRDNIKLIDQEWLHVGKTIEDIGTKIAGLDPRIKAVISVVRAIGSALKKIVTTVLDVAKGIAKWSFKTAVNMVKRLGSGIKNLAKGVADFGKNMVKNMYDRSALKSLADEFSRIRNIISTFGRIAFYRAVRSAIKYVTDALQQGTENAYWFAKKFGDATAYIAEAYDNLSSSNFKMSNQLGAAWSTMIATIEPILIRLIELVTRAADAVTQFFAALSGKTIYMRAIDYTKDWADETDKGAEKAKEWKNQLMGFDEINRLEAPSDTSGSSKTDLYKDYENMFEEAEIGGIFKKIRELIDSNQWDKLGVLLGNKFNDLVNKFDWSGWGAKIGRGIQYGIDFAYDFLNTADFQNLGSKIADFINSAGDNINNFEQLGRTTRKLRLAIWNMLYGAVTTLNWKAWAGRISDYIIGSLNELADWLSKLDAGKIAKAIKDFFGNIKYEEIRDSFVNVISTAWTKAIELKDALFDEDTKAKLSTAINGFFTGLTWDDVKQTVSEKLKGAFSFFIDTLDDVWPERDRQAFISSATEDVKAVFENVVKSAFSELKESIKGFVGLDDYESTADWFIIDVMHLPSNDEWKQYGLNALAFLSDGFKDIGSELKTVVVDPIDKLVNEDIPQTLSWLDNTFLQPIKEKVEDVKATFGTITDYVRDTFSVDWENAWAGVRSFFEGIFDGLDSILKAPINGIISMLNTAIDSINWVIEGANQIPWVSIPTISYIPMLANGGFPEDGLFMANHGELVGKFSNGRTAVANNEQITEGIASAVYEAFTTAFQQTGGSNDKEVNIYLDGEKIAKSTTRYQRQFARATG